MSDIDQMQLRRLDVNGLIIFLGLMRHRKAVTVAAELNLTQSTISHALKRLRDVFDDELFLRKPHGMEPTARAVELEPKIKSAVDSLASAVKGPEVFDPSTSTQTFHIGAAYDLEMLTIIPSLSARLRKQAPHTKLVAGTLPKEETLRRLYANEIDVALGFYWQDTKQLITVPLFKQGYKVLARKGHSFFKSRKTLADYCRADHILTSQRLDCTGIVDTTLEKQNRSRQVAIVVSSFVSTLKTLEMSDLIATVPERLASHYVDQFNLEQSQPPLEIREFTVACIFHRRNERSPAIHWLVEQIKHITSIE